MKIGIIGAGLVGSTSAYAMVMNNVGREIVLVDLNLDRARAEADDLLHAVPFAHPLVVRAGNYADLANSQVVVITAGVGQRPGESRLDLLGRNAKVFKTIIPQVLHYAPNAILVVATNPVDIMTHLTARYAAQFGVPPARVVGTGTTLDTARFRALLAGKIGVDAQHVHAYVLGEHGDSEVLTWSLVSVSGIPLEDFCTTHRLTVCDGDRQEIDERVRKAAYHIISGKGATYYGIGSAVARIVNVILRDQRSILTVCSPITGASEFQDITFSLPHLLSGQGIVDTIMPRLDTEELNSLRKSGALIREVIHNLLEAGTSA